MSETTEAPVQGLPAPRRYAAIAAVSLGTILCVIDGAIPTVALPTIARSLNVDSSSAVLVITVYQLTLVMLLLPLSAVGDLIGHKRLFQWGQLLFTAATILCFFARSIGFLLVVRVLQAVGSAALLSVLSAMVRSIYPPKQLGRGLGLNSVMVSIAAALAPTAGGFILEVADWPWVFAAAAPFAVVSLVIGHKALPASAPRPGGYNLAGAMLNMASFGLIVGGLEALVHGNSPVVSGAIVVIGGAFLWGLVVHERGEKFPILPVDLLGRPVLALSALGAFLSFSASTALMVSMPFRLQHEFGLPPSAIGAMLAPWPLTIMFIAPLAGTLSDRIPAGLLGAVGMSIATAGLLLLAFLPAHPSYFDVAWRMSMTGGGLGLFFAPNARLLVGSAPRDRAASAGALVSTARLSGQTCGATLVAALLAAGIGDTRVPALVAAGLAIVAGLCSVARLRPSIREPKRSEDAVAQAEVHAEIHGG